MKRVAALLLLLAGCATPAPPLDDVVTVPGHVFLRISPARYGKPGPDFYLLDTEVTNAQYLAFLQDTGRKKIDAPGPSADDDVAFWAPDPHTLWTNNHPPPGTEDYPVALITIHDAVDYCDWLTKRHPGLGKFRLPTVDEWLIAAYGDGRAYPWGNEAVVLQLKDPRPGTEPVRWRPKDRSPEGLFGLMGNVSEFVLSSEHTRWMGSSYKGTTLTARQDYWGYWTRSESRSQAVGFRVLLDPSGR